MESGFYKVRRIVLPYRTGAIPLTSKVNAIAKRGGRTIFLISILNLKSTGID